MMEELAKVVEKFAQFELMVEPDAAKLLCKYTQEELESIASLFQNKDVLIVTKTLVEEVVGVGAGEKVGDEEYGRADEEYGKEEECRGEYEEEIEEEIEENQSIRKEVVINVVYSMNNLKSTGSYEGFLSYFRSRYSKLVSLISDRISPRPISSLRKIGTSDDVWIAGLVSDKRTTRSGHVIIELEDESGVMPVLIPKNSCDVVNEILPDEMIGVRGHLNGEKKLFIATDVIFPDIPEKRYQKKLIEQNGGYVVLTSDMHVGSIHFLEGAWNRFVRWLNCDVGDTKTKRMARNVSCILVCGDLVDGIGIYPKQETELSIDNIFEQYKALAEYIEDIPAHIKIVMCPGNHDIVRQAEPQPPLSENIQKFFDDRVIFVGNPSLIDVNGTRILMYHGRSLNDLIPTLGLSYERPAEAMCRMLIKRHLAPMYGSTVPIAPEPEDHLVIEEIPDVLHTGHVHVVDYMNYKGVKLINSGTWQSQTEYQKMKNLKPTPAKVPVLDTSSLKIAMLNFK